MNAQEHKNELEERRTFLSWGIPICIIKIAVSNGNYKLSNSNLCLLWNLLKIDPITPDDEQQLFSFLKGFATVRNIETRVESVEDICSFFVNIVCDEKNNFQNLLIEGIEAIFSMLITVNQSLRNIEKISKVSKSLVKLRIACSAITGTEHQPDKKINLVSKLSDFKVKVPPEQLKGVSVLWKIVIEAKKELVSMKAIEFLNMLYTQISEELEDQITKISLHFVHTAFEKLSIFYERIKKDNENRSREIVQLIKLIEEMLDESERKGNGGLIPLFALLKGKPLKLKVRIIDDNGAVIPEFEIQTHSNLTLWNLKIMIGNVLKLQPEVLQLSKSDVEIKDKNNGKTLQEIKIIQNEILKVKMKNEENNSKIRVLFEDGKLTEKAKIMIEEIFNKYSTDGKMNRLNAAIFIEKFIPNKFMKANLRVDTIFKDNDPEKKNYLTKENFFKYFERTIIYYQETIFEKLKRLGYSNLNPESPEKSAQIFTIIFPEQLPRYILSNNPDYLQFLFSLLSMHKYLFS